ncbi:MAG: hypothetical protein FWG80_03290 [Alphaproteobacteria bacterium]|nr:hypothetical protein [Alphaproteobacteria bacterium]
MTREEFFLELKSRKVTLLSTASDRAIELSQNALQQMRAAMMPLSLIEIYRNISGGLISGDANIFGPEEVFRPARGYEIPGLIQINREILGMPGLQARTVFGRNQMFWFAFDAFGNFYMLDILNLNPLRKYESDPYRAILDCLAVGKI